MRTKAQPGRHDNVMKAIGAAMQCAPATLCSRGLGVMNTGGLGGGEGRDEGDWDGSRGPGRVWEERRERTRVLTDSHRTSLTRDVGDITSHAGAKKGNMLLLTS